MIDFLMISTRSTKRGAIEIYPKFIIKKSSDLMIRGGDFYAIWIEERGLWSTDEQDALQLIDRELDRYAEENRQRFDSGVDTMQQPHCRYLVATVELLRLFWGVCFHFCVITTGDTGGFGTRPYECHATKEVCSAWRLRLHYGIETAC